MAQSIDQLPEDLDSLKALVVELSQDNSRKSAQIIYLQEQLNLALARRCVASSEKLSPDQIRLFDEAEAEVLPEAPAAGDDNIEIPAHTRKKRGRKPLPAALPRVEVIHELPEAERCCPHDGQVLKIIGEETSEQLDIVPAKIPVIRHVRKRYACGCGQCIRTPAQPIPKSLASPGLLAHITVSKYQDALPLYRQETILQRIGVDLPRATLANWMVRAGQLIQPLINLIRDRLLAHDLIQMDETTVQVLKESGKTAQSKSYVWLQRGGPPGHPGVV